MAATVNPRATPTASFNPSQTQVSAPVLEYRCMFTHDIRKKAKKWHDGSLRFHTFNKRVMVYDDTKNLVGGLHYRSSEEFAEGVELNLDTHVLVQVEEHLGQSNTDLTPLLGRHNQDGADNFARPNPPTRATLSRINAANSQIKPKSIKELLSASQGATGRSRLLNKSPYEERHALSESQSVERNPKRQKLVHGKENNITATSSIQPELHSKELPQKVPPARQREVIEVLSDDSSDSRPQKKRKTAAKEVAIMKVTCPTIMPAPIASQDNAPVRPTLGRQGVMGQKDNTPIAIPRDSQTHKSRPKEKRPHKERPASVITSTTAPSPVAPTTTSPPSPIRHLSGPRSSLKFSSARPRPKLMYKALLAGSSNAASSIHENSTAATSIRNYTPDRRNADREPQRRPRSNTRLEMDNLFAMSQDDEEVNASLAINESTTVVSDQSLSHKAVEQADSVEEEIDTTTVNILADEETETIPDSPLFLPRTFSQLSPSRSQVSFVDNNDLSFLSQAISRDKGPTAVEEIERRSEALSVASSPRNDNAGCPPGSVSSPVFQRLLSEGHVREKQALSPSPVHDGEVLLDTPVKPFDAELPPVLSKQTPVGRGRLFRRVVSENIQRNHDSSDMEDDDDARSLGRSPSPDVLEQSPVNTRRTPVQPQSFSDPVDILLPGMASSPYEVEDCSQQSNTVRTREDTSAPSKEPDLIPVPVEESGPWTSTEAFLLFDWWPPGRDKPPYSKNVFATTTSNEPRVNPNLRKKYGTFGSAKFVSQR